MQRRGRSWSRPSCSRSRSAPPSWRRRPEQPSDRPRRPVPRTSRRRHDPPTWSSPPRSGSARSSRPRRGRLAIEKYLRAHPKAAARRAGGRREEEGEGQDAGRAAASDPARAPRQAPQGREEDHQGEGGRRPPRGRTSSRRALREQEEGVVALAADPRPARDSPFALDGGIPLDERLHAAAPAEEAARVARDHAGRRTLTPGSRHVDGVATTSSVFSAR